MDGKIDRIKKWLDIGSINIFGIPMSGKDTVGKQLAEVLDGKFLSSGEIIREMEAESGEHTTDDGSFTPTNMFYKWVLPYFEKRELWHSPLILSSIGRWAGEENEVMRIAEESDHPIKAVVWLKISQEELEKRWNAAKQSGDRGNRADDQNLDIMKNRLNNFEEKTLPVLKHYEELGMLIVVDANAPREEVFERVINQLSDFCA